MNENFTSLLKLKNQEKLKHFLIFFNPWKHCWLLEEVWNSRFWGQGLDIELFFDQIVSRIMACLHTPKLKNLHKIDPSLIPLLLLLETNTQIAKHKKVESALLLLYCTAFLLPKALLGFAWLNTCTNVRGHILHYWALEKPEGGKRELEKCVSERCRKRSPKRRWHCCCQKSEA